MKTYLGGCLCGAVRYRIVGEPIDVNICYCTQCRRQTGSPMAVFPTYPFDRYEVLQGKPASIRVSDFATRQFCRDCGSPLIWRRDGSTDIDIFLGTLDEPDRMPKPNAQIWTQHRISWVHPYPEIEAHRASRQEG
jgi:hypothetical protein